jgi:hypothetical protein
MIRSKGGNGGYTPVGSRDLRVARMECSVQTQGSSSLPPSLRPAGGAAGTCTSTSPTIISRSAYSTTTRTHALHLLQLRCTTMRVGQLHQSFSASEVIEVAHVTWHAPGHLHGSCVASCWKDAPSLQQTLDCTRSLLPIGQTHSPTRQLRIPPTNPSRAEAPSVVMRTRQAASCRPARVSPQMPTAAH